MSSYHHLSVSTFGLFLLILCVPSYGRFITFRPLTSDLISDGVHDCDSAESSTSTCDQTYGFLPCTTSVMGNLFLMVVYGYLMYLAAKLLSDGSELLLGILGPGFVAGLVLPILGALPEALLVLVSGIFGTTETAQIQVSVGMGMVAGSTIILLTIIWGSSVVVGKCDLVDSVAQDGKDEKKGFSLTVFFRCVHLLWLPTAAVETLRYCHATVRNRINTARPLPSLNYRYKAKLHSRDLFNLIKS